MPKNDKKGVIKRTISKYAGEGLTMLLEELDKNLDTIPKKIAKFIAMRKIFKKYLWHTALLISGIVIFSFGLGNLLESVARVFPGFWYMIIGIILVIIAIVYKKSI